MGANTSLLFSVVAISGSLPFVANAFDAELEFNYLPIGVVRTDPIVNQTCLSDHVHMFYGPPKLRPEVTTADLLATAPEEHSGLIEENKSLYWHPAIYRYDLESGLYTIDEVHYVSVYYFWDTDNELLEPFPEGFRMIATDPYAFAACLSDNGAQPTPCVRPDGCATPSTFFPQEACEMLEVTMNFPSCWDGELDSADHRSHMAFPDEDDICQPPHNRHLPTVSISVYLKDYDGGWHTFSDESDVFHADYLAGWDPAVLQATFDGCAQDVENCHTFVTFKNGIGPTGDDSHPQKRSKVLQVLPDPPLDTRATIAPEAIDGITELPRGTCTGTLLPPAGGPTPSPPPPPPPVDEWTLLNFSDFEGGMGSMWALAGEDSFHEDGYVVIQEDSSSSKITSAWIYGISSYSQIRVTFDFTAWGWADESRFFRLRANLKGGSAPSGWKNKKTLYYGASNDFENGNQVIGYTVTFDTSSANKVKLMFRNKGLSSEDCIEEVWLDNIRIEGR